jgi:integrase
VWAMNAVEAWTAAARIRSGGIFRAMRRGDRPAGEALTSHSIYAVVTENAARLGLKIAPHDLRRTHARLAWLRGIRRCELPSDTWV